MFVFTINVRVDDSNIDISLQNNSFNAIFYNQQLQLMIEVNPIMLLFLRIEQRLGSYSRTSMKCSLKVNLHVTIPLFIFVILCIILMLHNATSNTVPCLEILFCYDKFSTLM